jgi:hypothetical protein
VDGGVISKHAINCLPVVIYLIPHKSVKYVATQNNLIAVEVALITPVLLLNTSLFRTQRIRGKKIIIRGGKRRGDYTGLRDLRWCDRI